MAGWRVGNQEIAAEGDQGAHGIGSPVITVRNRSRLVIHPREGGPSGRSSRPSACERMVVGETSPKPAISFTAGLEPAVAPGRPRLPVRRKVDRPVGGRRIRLLEAPVQVTSETGRTASSARRRASGLRTRLRRPWRCAPVSRGDPALQALEGTVPDPAQGRRRPEWRCREVHTGMAAGEQ